MLELYPHVYVSPRATIAPSCAFGRGVVIYGPSVLGPNTLIEDNVTVGHPSPDEIQMLRGGAQYDLAAIYDDLSSGTVVGANAIIRSGTVLYSSVSVGRRFDCGHNVIIRERSQIGDDVYVMSGCIVKSEVVLGMGSRVSNSVADRTVVEACASMLGTTTHDYRVGVGGVKEAAPHIGRGATVGRGALVVGEVAIGDFTLVGAGAVVVTDISPMVVAIGAPARAHRSRTDAEVDLVRARLAQLESS